MRLDEIAEINEKALVINGFDEAILYMIERIGSEPVVLYDSDKIIQSLMKDMDVSVDDLSDDETIEDKKYEMALEYFEFNIKGAWVGENTPFFTVIR